ncbi:hypothetical protein GJ744_002058 [Endocarpon pusillum]|uniref:Mitochondrial thiamine pyrophosphate carrier 1 n=1 Tax=Endocarpon pusillum TaxID=364733 RepID=A0A8H7ACJ7_9EURO|nr:hypothetical protein GJ744_002058 [Endocarpon pusillum]
MAADNVDARPKPSALRSIIAGSTAGAVEIAITYPAEFAKTRSQLNRRLPNAEKLPWPPFGRQWYAGCTTLIIGNSLKAGIRTFFSPQECSRSKPGEKAQAREVERPKAK